jgi:hypothetical protein
VLRNGQTVVSTVTEHDCTYLVCRNVFYLLVPELFVIDISSCITCYSGSLAAHDHSSPSSAIQGSGRRLHDTGALCRRVLLRVSVDESIQE